MRDKNSDSKVTRREFVKYSALMSGAAAGLAGMTAMTDALAQEDFPLPANLTGGNNTAPYTYHESNPP